MDKDLSAHDGAMNVATPAVVVVTGKTANTIKISWAYTLGRRQATRFIWEHANQPVGQDDVPKEHAFHYTIQGLKPNTKYLIRAFGLVDGEVSPGSANVEGTTESES